MNPKDAYKFCPKCGGKLTSEKNNLLICKNCSFRFYINPLPCNAVIIENEKGEIMLVKRKFEPKKGFWDLPGGFIIPNESLEASVKREIKEELGVDVAIIKLIGVYDDTYFYEGIDYPTLGIAVLAKITSGEIKVADDVETFSYFQKSNILTQNLAFQSLRNAISDYLKNF